MEDALITVERVPLPKRFKVIIWGCFMSAGLSFLSVFLSLILGSNEETDLSSVGQGTVVITNSNGGTIVHSNGVSKSNLFLFFALISFAIGLTFLLIDKLHKNDKISVYEDRIEFVQQKENLSFTLREIEQCNLVKDITIRIKVTGIDKPFELFCMEKSKEVVQIINKEKNKTT